MHVKRHKLNCEYYVMCNVINFNVTHMERVVQRISYTGTSLHYTSTVFTGRYNKFLACLRTPQLHGVSIDTHTRWYNYA